MDPNMVHCIELTLDFLREEKKEKRVRKRDNDYFVELSQFFLKLFLLNLIN